MAFAAAPSASKTISKKQSTFSIARCAIIENLTTVTCSLKTLDVKYFVYFTTQRAQFHWFVLNNQNISYLKILHSIVVITHWKLQTLMKYINSPLYSDWDVLVSLFLMFLVFLDSYCYYPWKITDVYQNVKPN